MVKPPKKILIIDDEAVFLEASKNALIPCGYFCITKQDPSEGIMQLKKDSIDLVLLDIMMDPVDGWDILNHIRSHTNGNMVPVMMSSAKKLHPDELIRYGDSMDGFIIKPFLDSELCETVNEFFSFYETLLKISHAALIQGVPESVRKKWVQLNRQIRAMNQIKEILTPPLIIQEPISPEEFLQQRLFQINQIITQKQSERDLIQFQYPVFRS